MEKKIEKALEELLRYDVAYKIGSITEREKLIAWKSILQSLIN
jgi:hypothetical protein